MRSVLGLNVGFHKDSQVHHGEKKHVVIITPMKVVRTMKKHKPLYHLLRSLRAIIFGSI